MAGDLLQYLPAKWRMPLAIVGIAGAVISAGMAYVAFFKPTASANEAWADISSSEDPCVLEAFANSYANDATYVRLAAQKLSALGSCTRNSSTSAVAQHSIASGDTLLIVVADEPDLSGRYQVYPEGNVMFPLLGSVTASGRTSTQFSAELSAALQSRGYLQAPRIRVEVIA
ncbi:MAG: polysaccharide biosynthesis/export family protein [Hyphomonadaceae bacterium]|nr:polysaccharide biosynthesis/export family protein [Hyphomonadaceae bacterium]